MTTNYCISEETQGFNKAMDFFSSKSREKMSKQMVLSIAKQVLDKTSHTAKSSFGAGFYDAAVIIARTRPATP